jgi:hypothetical protein
VGNGQYYVKIDSVDPYGAETSVTATVMVNRPSSELSITVYNEAGEVVRRLFRTVTAEGQSVQGVRLSSDTIQPGYLPVAGGPPQSLAVVLSDGTAVLWDGRGDDGSFVGNGQYYVEVRSQDASGGEQVVTKPVAVLSTGVSGLRVTARPNVVTAKDPVTLFEVQPALALDLEVTVYALSGEKVKGLRGTGQVRWDTTGLARGLYLAVVEVLDASGQVDRQVLRILIQ